MKKIGCKVKLHIDWVMQTNDQKKLIILFKYSYAEKVQQWPKRYRNTEQQHSTAY
jgi:hypothetical protein